MALQRAGDCQRSSRGPRYPATKGRPGGKLSTGKPASRSPCFNFSAAEWKAATRTRSTSCRRLSWPPGWLRARVERGSEPAWRGNAADPARGSTPLPRRTGPCGSAPAPRRRSLNPPGLGCERGRPPAIGVPSRGWARKPQPLLWRRCPLTNPVQTVVQFKKQSQAVQHRRSSGRLRHLEMRLRGAAVACAWAAHLAPQR